MATKRDTSNSGIYDRLDILRREVKDDINSAVSQVTVSTNAAVNSIAVSQGRLEKKFDELEQGRLTRAEGYINDLRLQIQGLGDREKTNNSKWLGLDTIRNIIISAASAAFFIWLFTKGSK